MFVSILSVIDFVTSSLVSSGPDKSSLCTPAVALSTAYDSVISASSVLSTAEELIRSSSIESLLLNP